MEIKVTLLCPIKGIMENVIVEDATFTKLRQLICCSTAEVIHLSNDKLLFIDEEGLLENKLVNDAATAIVRSVYKQDIMMDQGIRGTALIVKQADLEAIPYSSLN